ncbi:hypothetical protein BHE74_00010435 [Ensete ventricosum]|nr:hypothetical protein BHE74_00010435 [Ensete ventricosum]RZR87150.1 hypothetical protein BHM03_00014512 [Ensete ventricosum]
MYKTEATTSENGTELVIGGIKLYPGIPIPYWAVCLVAWWDNYKNKRQETQNLYEKNQNRSLGASTKIKKSNGRPHMRTGDCRVRSHYARDPVLLDVFINSSISILISSGFNLVVGSRFPSRFLFEDFRVSSSGFELGASKNRSKQCGNECRAQDRLIRHSSKKSDETGQRLMFVDFVFWSYKEVKLTNQICWLVGRKEPGDGIVRLIDRLIGIGRRFRKVCLIGVEGAVPDTTGGKEARGNSARYDRKELVTYQSHSRLGSPLWKKLSMRQGRKQMVEKNGAISKARMEYLSRG